MGDKMLGRWMARLVVTVGVGAMALGLSSVAAHASNLAQRPVLIQITDGSNVKVAPSAPVYVTEDFGWD
ncbi:hypothetical protein AB0M46_27565 [Dactylosporangium sp. NPDC051485]|uniref:hypothetical protein n=1 Tax=Dactylosporangium sp. NPDC051485 TaxID=3154846 RepID=UPI00341DB1F2